MPLSLREGTSPITTIAIIVREPTASSQETAGPQSPKKLGAHQQQVKQVCNSTLTFAYRHRSIDLIDGFSSTLSITTACDCHFDLHYKNVRLCFISLSCFVASQSILLIDDKTFVEFKLYCNLNSANLSRRCVYFTRVNRIKSFFGEQSTRISMKSLKC